MKLSGIIPMLPVSNLDTAVGFYGRLGFQTEKRNDQWGWAMLRLDDSRLMLDRSINRHPQAPRQSVLYLYPADIQAYHAQIREAGLCVPDLSVTFYGMTEFRLDDPDGNRLWIGGPPP